MSRVLTFLEVENLTQTQRRNLNQSTAPIDRKEWRFDAYRSAAVGPRYDFCRALNNPLGIDWCSSPRVAKWDVPGHAEVPLRGCELSGKFRAHACCRCGYPGHGWSQCITPDHELESSLLELEQKPPRDRDAREADKKDRRERFQPLHTSWPSTRWERR